MKKKDDKERVIKDMFNFGVGIMDSNGKHIDFMDAFSEQLENSLSDFKILIPSGKGEYVPPVYPEPKYPIGTKYKQWKYFSWDHNQPQTIDGNYQVDCEITGKMYYNEDSGWIYSAKPSEQVQVGDNYWNKSMTMDAFVSESELDLYFS